MLNRREILGAAVAAAVAATVKVTSRGPLVDRVALPAARPLCVLQYEFHAVASGTWADGTRAEIPLRLVRPGVFEVNVTRQVRLTSWRYEWRA